MKHDFNYALRNNMKIHNDLETYGQIFGIYSEKKVTKAVVNALGKG